MHSAPEAVREAVRPILSGLTPDRRQHFDLRLDRWWDDLVAGLKGAYGAGDHGAVAVRLAELAATAFRDRDPELQRLDEQRLLEPDWLQAPSMFGYACYTERFADDLRGVGDRLAHLRGLGVTYLHLMPLLRPREGDNDGGYAVQDYRNIRPDLGTNDDLRDLTRTLRSEGISLVLDLVVNHVAREHEWARRASAGEAHYRDYFHIYPDRSMPDRFEATLPEVFPDFAPGSFTWDDEVAGWVWTTFNEWQWDVNWSNPEVLLEYAGIIVHLANLGVEVLRLDAIAFMWKRLGTNCQNQPEVHHLTQVLRSIVRIACPATVFKAEAIVGPRDLVQYLGLGVHTGKISDLAYHNSLMVQAWSMLATGDTVLARQALGALPPTPPSGTWITYVRCHDDIGWAIDDGDAAAVGLGGFDHRDFLSSWYAGAYPHSWARGLVFQANPQTGDRRISGTTAALAGLEAATDEATTSLALARIFLVHALVAGWGGIPVIWSGDELGQPNDPDWAGEPGHEGDNRWAHRPRLDRSRAAAAGDGSTAASRIYQGVAHLSRIRAGLPQLHASADTLVLHDTDPGVFAALRQHPSGPMVCVYNVTSTWRPFALSRLHAAGIRAPFEALSGHDVAVGADGIIRLSPYAAWWVVDGRVPAG